SQKRSASDVALAIGCERPVRAAAAPARPAAGDGRAMPSDRRSARAVALCGIDGTNLPSQSRSKADPRRRSSARAVPYSPFLRTPVGDWIARLLLERRRERFFSRGSRAREARAESGAPQYQIAELAIRDHLDTFLAQPDGELAAAQQLEV